METTKSGASCAHAPGTHQAVELGDADVLRVHHCVLLPGHQVQAQLPGKQRQTFGRKGTFREYMCF